MAKFDFTITAKAAARVCSLMKKESDKPFLRISVDGGGCSGFMYKYDFTDAKEDKDVVIQMDRATFLIDDLSKQFLNDSTLDYIEELGAEYFQISNPNAKYKCGCGNSFGV